MQIPMNVATKEQIKNSWAFALQRNRVSMRSRQQRLHNLNQSIITACSKEAKNFGVRAGMRYEDAKQLLPDLRVLVYGATHARK